jgi:hypothetical protein
MRNSVAAVCAAVLPLAGCGGGGGSSSVSPNASSSGASTGMQSIHLKLVLGGSTSSGTPSANVRRPKFVSPSTKGIDVKVYAHGSTTMLRVRDRYLRPAELRQLVAPAHVLDRRVGAGWE